MVLSENSIEANNNIVNNKKVSYNITVSTNETLIPEKLETSTSRITEQATQEQHVPKSIELDRNESALQPVKDHKEFRPSPQVNEVVYERNMEDEYKRKPDVPWERPDYQQPWTTPIGFKFPQNNVQTSKDVPYAFDNGRTFQGFSGKNDYGGTSQKLQINLGEKIPVSSSGSGSGIGGSWDIIGTLHPEANYVPKKPINYGYDLGAYVEKPPTLEEHHVNHEYPMKKYDNPWKKIIKVIAAFIPIGLLISALTPTIITVSPMNNTAMRSRDDDPHSDTIKKLVSSLGYFEHLSDRNCENRILCELLLGASSSQNAERHIENFLANFADREKYTNQRIEELKAIFTAVKRNQCEVITCKGIKENT
ncbi:hypothetical protein WA026_013877 [Henosepilachna vigintioctopunctata]|uniref:Uncharacterized protein n=1 Tax=Henosepilachna vigintioctopunctata TaxID=420089 RepID=A0AAW1U774_9CUCU